MSSSLGKKAEDVGVAADELVASDDASGTKATAVARAVSQLLGEASKSGASTHVLQSAMNVADTAGKVIAAKRAKSDNVQPLNESLKGDIRALHEALKEEPSKVPAGPTPKKIRKLEKPEEAAAVPAEAPKSKDKAVKKEKEKKAKKAKDVKKTEEVVEQREVVQHEETRTVQSDNAAPAAAPLEYEPVPEPAPTYEPQHYDEFPVTRYEEPAQSYVQDDFAVPHYPPIVQHADHVDPNLPTQHITVNGTVSAPHHQESFLQQSFAQPSFSHHQQMYSAPAFNAAPMFNQSFGYPQQFGGFMPSFFPQQSFFGGGGPLYVPMIPLGDFGGQNERAGRGRRDF